MQGSTRSAARAAVAALSLVAAAACASSKTPERADTPQAVAESRGPGGRQGRLLAGITLSDAQRASIDSIRAAYRERMGTDRAAGGDRAQWRRAMEEQQAAIRNVLTSDQQRIFDQNVAQMRQRRGRRG